MIFHHLFKHTREKIENRKQKTHRGNPDRLREKENYVKTATRRRIKKGKFGDGRTKKGFRCFGGSEKTDGQ